MAIDIEKLTVAELREISKLAGCCAPKDKAVPLPFKPGDKIIVRTVTMIDVGKVVSIGRDFLVLCEGGWVADTGRFSTMLKTGSLNEFELAEVPWMLIGRGAICDAFPWLHDLPKATK